jgi:hypothetical protein
MGMGRPIPDKASPNINTNTRIFPIRFNGFTAKIF